MTTPREQLIDELSRDLRPTPRPISLGLTAIIATLLLIAASFALLVLSGEMRPGSGADLLNSLQFSLETLAGLAATGLLLWGALRLSLPDAGSPLARAMVPFAALAVWLGLYLYALVSPALDPSMVGKREGCWLDTVLIGLPGLVLVLGLCRRLWPLHGAWSGTLAGLAAGSATALAMQFACMYVPAHTLLHHLAPGLALGLLGAVAGAISLRRR